MDKHLYWWDKLPDITLVTEVNKSALCKKYFGDLRIHRSLKDKEILKIYESEVIAAPIYILSSDGYRDSANLHNYARNEDELKRFVAKELKEIGFVVIDITRIDYEEGIIYLTYADVRYDDEPIKESDIEKREYHFYTLNPIR